MCEYQVASTRRTSWVGMVIVILAAWVWRRHWPDRRGPWIVTALGVYFLVCVLSVSALREVFLGGSLADLQELTRATMASETWPQP